VGNISRQHQQHITPLLPINLIKNFLLNFPIHKHPHQPVNFRRILLLLLPDIAGILHRQHQETSAIRLLLLQQLRNHKSKSIQKPALPLNPFRHRFLLLQARSEKIWNFVATTKKCELTIVNEYALTKFHTIFPLTHFLFQFLPYSLLVIFTSSLSISVSYFGCLTTSCRFFDACYEFWMLVTIILVWPSYFSCLPVYWYRHIRWSMHFWCV